MLLSFTLPIQFLNKFKNSVCMIARLWCGCVRISAPHSDPVFLLLISGIYFGKLKHSNIMWLQLVLFGILKFVLYNILCAVFDLK
jgi:hypothetical protein